jgi:stage II sporulation protein D
LAYLVSRACTNCRHAPHHAWTHETDAVVLAAALGVPGPLREVRLGATSPSGRVQEVRATAADGTVHAWKGSEFRLLVGSRALRSTLFTVTNSAAGWIFSGNGWGHGVGFCQWGAEALGRQGKSAEEILHFYFNEVTIGGPSGALGPRRPTRTSRLR